MSRIRMQFRSLRFSEKLAHATAAEFLSFIADVSLKWMGVFRYFGYCDQWSSVRKFLPHFRWRFDTFKIKLFSTFSWFETIWVNEFCDKSFLFSRMWPMLQLTFIMVQLLGSYYRPACKEDVALSDVSVVELHHLFLWLFDRYMYPGHWRLSPKMFFLRVTEGCKIYGVPAAPPHVRVEFFILCSGVFAYRCSCTFDFDTLTSIALLLFNSVT